MRTPPRQPSDGGDDALGADLTAAQVAGERFERLARKIVDLEGHTSRVACHDTAFDSTRECRATLVYER
jgi:hypothetical protein